MTPAKHALSNVEGAQRRKGNIISCELSAFAPLREIFFFLIRCVR